MRSTTITTMLLILALPVAAQDAETMRAQSEAYTQAWAAVYQRDGDPFVLCTEGPPPSHGWRPQNPVLGTYVITRYCPSPCPYWPSLRAYQSICPQALSTGPWTGPGGPGQVGQYQSSGGSQYVGDADNPSGLQPRQH